MKNLICHTKQNNVVKPQQYEAPSIEIIEVKVERGFQSTAPNPVRENETW